MKIVGVSGSLSQSGRTRAAVAAALEGSGLESGVATELLDLRDYAVEFVDGRPPELYNTSTREIVRKIEESDGVIFATPVYRGTYTGALKNLLDHLPLEALWGKAVGLIATGSALHHYLAIDYGLRTVMAWFGAVAWPIGVYVPDSAYSKDGEITDFAVRKELEQLGRGIARLSQVLQGLGRPLPPPLAARH